MNGSILKRLAVLEGAGADEIVLYMPPGTEPGTHRIRGGKHLLNLFSQACKQPDEFPELEWIKNSLSDNESEQAGGGHMLELLRALLSTPVESPTSPVTGALEQKQ